VAEIFQNAPTHERSAGNGTGSRPRSVADDIVCPDCGSVFRGPKKRGKQRSAPQHRRTFGLIAKAFANWPEQYEFQPRDAEHLRAWLLVQAGYADVPQTIRCDDENAIRVAGVVRAAFQAAQSNAFVETKGNRVLIVTPKSMSFDKLPHLHACVIMQAIDELIEDIVGVSCDQLLRERAI